jgi:hypothetical protein
MKRKDHRHSKLAIALWIFQAICLLTNAPADDSVTGIPVEILTESSAHPLAARVAHLPIVKGGKVHAIEALPNGKIIVGGEFTSINDQPIKYLARINADGSVDTSWNPSCNSTVYDIARTGNTLFVCGSFSSIGGLSRTGLAKISAEGPFSIEAGFNARLSGGSVNALSVDETNGRIYVAGGFSKAGTTPVFGLIRFLTTNSSFDSSWIPVANPHWSSLASMTAIALSPDNNWVFVGGQNQFGDSYLVGKIDQDGNFDSEWNPQAYGGNQYIAKIVVTNDSVFIGGDFWEMGGLTQWGIAKLDYSGNADTAWRLDLDEYRGTWYNFSVTDMLISGEHLYLAGSFGYANGMRRAGLARVDSDGMGSLDANWAPSVNELIRALGLLQSGNLLCGGQFTEVNDQHAVGLAQVSSGDGSLNSDFSTGVFEPGIIATYAEAPDGSIFVGGDFVRIGQQPAANVARVLSSGVVDATWTPQVNGSVNAVAANADYVYIGGKFTKINETNWQYLARFDINSGALDQVWNPPLHSNGNITAFYLDQTHLYIGGWADLVNWPGAGTLVRLTTIGTGAVDPTWMPLIENYVNNGNVGAIVGDQDWVYAAGQFGSVGGLERYGLVRLGKVGNGEADTTWNPRLAIPLDDGNPWFYSASAWPRWLQLSERHVKIAGSFASYASGVRQTYTVGRFAVGDTYISICLTEPFSGVPISGATVTVKQFGAVFWQGQTDPTGCVTVPGLLGDFYTVIASKDGYVTSVTNSDGRADGIHTLQVALTPIGAPPDQTAVTRVPAETAIRPAPSGPVSSHFRVFVGTQWGTNVNSVDLNAMTVVINHGWNSGLNDWAKTLAYQIANGHGLATPPNIVAWDWSAEAATTAPPVDKASEQGLALGKALHQVLGENYNKHVHFIGHSLGTIVNSYACDYVHRGFARQSMNPNAGWSSSATQPHITLLDEAGAVPAFGQNVPASSEVIWQQSLQTTGFLVGGAETAVINWRSPIPRIMSEGHGWMIDNYISAFGRKHSAAVNVSLVAPLLSLPTTSIGSLRQALEDAHGYSHLFYRNSIDPDGTPPAVGFALSAASGATFTPTGPGMTPGSWWYENIDTPDAFDLSQTIPDLGGIVDSSFTGEFPALSALTVQFWPYAYAVPGLGSSVLQGYDASIQWAGNIGGNVIYTTGNVIADTTQKVGLWWDAAQDQAADILNSVDPSSLLTGPLGAPVFQIRLSTGSAQQPQMAKTFSLLKAAPMSDGTSSEPAAWFTIQVPADAAFIAFDFKVTGTPVDDRIACAINDQNLFTLPAAFAPDGQTVSTDLLDVTAYAGQTVEVFFGLTGGTSTDCEVTIDGLRFITLPKPTLSMASDETGLSVQWPAAATGWTLQYSDSLLSGSWTDVTPDAEISVMQGISTLPIETPSNKMFFRLKKNP